MKDLSLSAESIFSQTSSPSLINLFFFLVVGFLLYWLLKRVMSFLSHTALARRASEFGFNILLKLLFPVAFTAFAIHRMGKESRSLELYIFVFFGLVFAFTLVNFLKDFIPALGLLITNRVREGEYIKIGDHEGTLKSISIFNLELVNHSGEKHLLPISQIKDYGIKRISQRLSNRLRVLVKFSKQFDVLDLVKTRISFLPYFNTVCSFQFDHELEGLVIDTALVPNVPHGQVLKAIKEIFESAGEPKGSLEVVELK